MTQHPLLNHNFLYITATNAVTNLTTFNEKNESTDVSTTEVVTPNWKFIVNLISISIVSTPDTSHALMKTILALFVNQHAPLANGQMNGTSKTIWLSLAVTHHVTCSELLAFEETQVKQKSHLDLLFFNSSVGFAP